MKSMKKFGPVSITETGEYSSIKSMGPLTIKVPDEEVKAESVKSLGPAVLKTHLNVEKISVNGPCTGEGTIMANIMKVNGPVKYSGNINVSEVGKINGPCVVSGSIIGKEKAILTINGPLEFSSITDFLTLKINGPTTGLAITNAGVVKIRGKVVLDKIQVRDNLTISLGKGETVIKSITGGDVEIGILEEHSGFFGKMFKERANEPRIAFIEEIHSTGKVELDNVKVKKVTAKELYAGENTEIGEFIEIDDN